MEFVITRTHSWFTDKMTDDEIIKDIDLPLEFDAKVKTIELNNGRKERVVVIKLNEIEDLIKLREKVNHELIITTSMCTDIPEIEIYDSWRE